MAGLTITVQYLLLMCIVWGAWFHWMLLADQGDCRRLKFVLPVDGKRLESHIFLNLSIGIYTQCEHRCAMESRCVSVNIGPSKENDKVTCELNDADHLQFPDDLKDHPGWTYRGTENPCSGRNPCFHNGTCMSGYSDKRFICLCPAGYTGEHCEQAVLAASCKEQYEKHSSNKSQVYQLMVDSQKIPVYCHMGDFGCGNGGWTLAMKIDGTKKTFHYDSSFWNNRNAYNLTGGKTGFDAQQTKLPTYWNTSFSKICLGMKIGKQIRFLVVNKQAQSLYALIADGKYRATSLGRNTWKTLIGSQASLQANCNKEGFNTAGSSKGYSKARIGILGNNENDCTSTDSRIGFGTGGNHDDSNTCGNYAGEGYASDNGAKNIKSMGYILVQ